MVNRILKFPTSVHFGNLSFHLIKCRVVCHILIILILKNFHMHFFLCKSICEFALFFQSLGSLEVGQFYPSFKTLLRFTHHCYRLFSISLLYIPSCFVQGMELLTTDTDPC